VSLLTIVIPTLGRPGLLRTLEQIKLWRQTQSAEYQSFNVLIFHNARSSGSQPLESPVLNEIESLNATLVTGDSPLEGAEISFREALKWVKSGYVLPLTDDNIFVEDGLKQALAVAAENSYDWVHFNSITNGRPNYLIEDLFYSTSAQELVSRIGLNFSLCCISRSLFRLEMIDTDFWDNLLDGKQSVFSWSAVLAKSFQSSRVAISSVPIEIRSVHSYDRSMTAWHSQWSDHARINNDGAFFPFTVHLGKMYESLIAEKVLRKSEMSAMVVMESNILRPLHVEMANLSFLHAYQLRNNPHDIPSYLNHIKLLQDLFPQLREIYVELTALFEKSTSKRNKRALRSIEFRYRKLVGFDGFSLMRVMGDGKTNIMRHPLGRLFLFGKSEHDNWKSGFFVFSKRKEIALGVHLSSEIKEWHSLQFDLTNDDFYSRTSSAAVFPVSLKNRVIESKVAFLAYSYLPKRVQLFLVKIFLEGNKNTE
jgi:hypothetical protein